MNLHKLNQQFQDGETLVVSIIIQIAPWLAPIAPAYLAFYNLTHRLGFFPPVAVAVALTIEMLGIATINTALMFWRHNLRYKDPKRKSPVWIPTLAFFAYLVIVLSINVFLELRTISEYIPVLVKAFLTFLSIPAALTLAIRLQHSEMISEISSENAERRSSVHKPRSAAQNPVISAQPNSSHMLDQAQVLRIDPFLCISCGRRFAKQQQLAAHLRVHKRPKNGHNPEPVSLTHPNNGE